MTPVQGADFIGYCLLSMFLASGLLGFSSGVFAEASKMPPTFKLMIRHPDQSDKINSKVDPKTPYSIRQNLSSRRSQNDKGKPLWYISKGEIDINGKKFKLAYAYSTLEFKPMIDRVAGSGFFFAHPRRYDFESRERAPHRFSALLTDQPKNHLRLYEVLLVDAKAFQKDKTYYSNILKTILEDRLLVLRRCNTVRGRCTKGQDQFQDHPDGTGKERFILLDDILMLHSREPDLNNWFHDDRKLLPLAMYPEYFPMPFSIVCISVLKCDPQRGKVFEQLRSVLNDGRNFEPGSQSSRYYRTVGEALYADILAQLDHDFIAWVGDSWAKTHFAEAQHRALEASKKLGVLKPKPVGQVVITLYDPAGAGGETPPEWARKFQVSLATKCEDWRNADFVALGQATPLPETGGEGNVCVVIRTGEKPENSAYCIVHPVVEGDAAWHIDAPKLEALDRFSRCQTLTIQVTFRDDATNGKILASTVRRYQDGAVDFKDDENATWGDLLEISEAHRLDFDSYKVQLEKYEYKGFELKSVTEPAPYSKNKLKLTVRLAPKYKKLEDLVYRFHDSNMKEVDNCFSSIIVPPESRLILSEWKEFPAHQKFDLKYDAGELKTYGLALKTKKGVTLNRDGLEVDTRSSAGLRLVFDKKDRSGESTKESKCSTNQIDISPEEIEAGTIQREVLRVRPTLTFIVFGGMGTEDQRSFGPLDFGRVWETVVHSVRTAHEALRDEGLAGRSATLLVDNVDITNEVQFSEPDAVMLARREVRQDFLRRTSGLFEAPRSSLRLRQTAANVKWRLRKDGLQNGLVVVTGFAHGASGELCSRLVDDATLDRPQFGAKGTVYIALAHSKSVKDPKKSYLRPLNDDQGNRDFLYECLTASGDGAPEAAAVPKKIRTAVLFPRVGWNSEPQLKIQNTVKDLIVEAFRRIPQ